MCARMIEFPKWSEAEMDKLQRSFEKMIQEAREFHEVVDSLPLTSPKPDTE